MAKRRIDLRNGLRDAVSAAARVLGEGGVLVFPTETVYGIGVAAGDADALEKLRGLKQRDRDKPFQFLVADVGMATALGAVFGPGAGKLARAFWPGPLTLVVPDGAGATLGIRIPDSPFVLELCRELGRAVISSSANPAGAPPPLDGDAADVFGDAVDLLVDGGRVVGGVPSTVVLCGETECRILRSGGVPDDAIESAWEE